MKPIERISILISYYRTNISAFEKECGLSNNSIGSAIRRNTSIKDETLNRVLIAYPKVNPEWLLTGEGEMLRGENKKNAQELEPNFERLENALARLILDVGYIKEILEEKAK
ncbi:hypothetical protein N9Y48_02875 [Zobellia sp.]|nr:hypothetical protein [Zobellia sp.]